MERLTISGTKEAKNDITIRQIIDKLAEYEDLEEQGKLLNMKSRKDVYGGSEMNTETMILVQHPTESVLQ